MFKTSCVIALILASIAMCRAEGLTVYPQTCVVDTEGVCQTRLQLIYESITPRSVCFRVNSLTQPVCRAPARRQEASLMITTLVALTIEVVDQQSAQVLARDSMLLAEFIPVSSRKRRRFSWSFQ